MLKSILCKIDAASQQQNGTKTNCDTLGGLHNWVQTPTRARGRAYQKEGPVRSYTGDMSPKSVRLDVRPVGHGRKPPLQRDIQGVLTPGEKGKNY